MWIGVGLKMFAKKTLSSGLALVIINLPAVDPRKKFSRRWGVRRPMQRLRLHQNTPMSTGSQRTKPDRAKTESRGETEGGGAITAQSAEEAGTSRRQGLASRHDKKEGQLIGTKEEINYLKPGSSPVLMSYQHQD